jgi:hypothetical protein
MRPSRISTAPSSMMPRSFKAGPRRGPGGPRNVSSCRAPRTSVARPMRRAVGLSPKSYPVSRKMQRSARSGSPVGRGAQDHREETAISRRAGGQRRARRRETLKTRGSGGAASSLLRRSRFVSSSHRLPGVRGGLRTTCLLLQLVAAFSEKGKFNLFIGAIEFSLAARRRWTSTSSTRSWRSYG